MNEQLLKAIEQILNNNIGNKITPELGTGIYLRIKTLMQQVQENGEHTRADNDTKEQDQ